MSYIEFDYGRSNLPESAEAKIKSIASAMNNRPALKLDISGRVDPVNDLEGLKQTSIERKVKAQKMKDLVRQGTAPKSVDEVQVDKAEYERYLKAATTRVFQNRVTSSVLPKTCRRLRWKV